MTTPSDYPCMVVGTPPTIPPTVLRPGDTVHSPLRTYWMTLVGGVTQFHGGLKVSTSGGPDKWLPGNGSLSSVTSCSLGAGALAIVCAGGWSFPVGFGAIGLDVQDDGQVIIYGPGGTSAVVFQYNASPNVVLLSEQQVAHVQTSIETLNVQFSTIARTARRIPADLIPSERDEHYVVTKSDVVPGPKPPVDNKKKSAGA